MATFHDTVEIIRKDHASQYRVNARSFRIIGHALFDPSFRAVVVYRLQRYAYVEKKETLFKILQFVRALIVSVEVSYQTIIGPCLKLPHPQCIAVGGGVIGDDLLLYQGVTIGATWDFSDFDGRSDEKSKLKDGRYFPIIGNNVRIGAGAAVLGPIKVGNNVFIGAHSVVTEDVPDNCVVAGAPARVVRWLQ